MSPNNLRTKGGGTTLGLPQVPNTGAFNTITNGFGISKSKRIEDMAQIRKAKNLLAAKELD